MGVGGRPLTSQVHPGLETLSYSTRWTVFPADLVDDAVVPSGTQVVVLTYCAANKRKNTWMLDMQANLYVLNDYRCLSCSGISNKGPRKPVVSQSLCKRF